MAQKEAASIAHFQVSRSSIHVRKPRHLAFLTTRKAREAERRERVVFLSMFCHDLLARRSVQGRLRLHVLDSTFATPLYLRSLLDISRASGWLLSSILIS